MTAPAKAQPSSRLRTSAHQYWVTILLAVLALLTGMILAWVFVQMQIEASHDLKALRACTTLRDRVATAYLHFETYGRDGSPTEFQEATADLRDAAGLSYHISELFHMSVRYLRPGVDQTTIGMLTYVAAEIDSLSALTAQRAKYTDPARAAAIQRDFDRIYESTTERLRRIQAALDVHFTEGRDREQLTVGSLLLIWLLTMLIGLGNIRRRRNRRRDDARVLRASESRFRDLADLLPVGVFETDADGVLVYANHDLARQCGLDEASIDRRTNLLSAIAPDERDRVRSWLRSVAEHEVIDSEEHRMVARDGSIFTALISVGPITSVGRPVGLRGIVADIADRKEAEDALRREKEKYQTLMRVAPVGIFRLDDNAACTYMNERGAGLLGTTAAEALGHGWLARICPDDRKRVSLALQTAIRDGHPQSLETCCLRADDSVGWIALSVEPERDDTGEVINYVGSIVDISERRQAITELRDSEVRFKRLSEAASEGIVIHENFKLLDCNQALVDLVGVPYNELIGADLRQFIEPEFHELVRDRIANGYTQPLEIAIRTAHGGSHPVEIIGSEMPFEGRTVRVAGVRDIAERQRAREEILKFKTISDAAHYGSTITDLSGQIIYVNRHFANMHGYEPEELVGTSIHDCFDLSSLPDFEKTVESLIASGHLTTRELKHRHRDGHTFPTLQSAIVVNDRNGTPTYIGGTSIDITELKRSERKLEELAALPENNPNLVLTVTAEGKLVYLNPAALRLLADHAEESVEIWNWLPPEALEIISECVATARNVVDAQHEHRGTVWSWAFHPVPGQPIVHCYGRDVTESQRQQSELRRLSAAVEQSASIVVITDPDGRVEYVNPQFTEVTGFTAEQAIGQPISFLRSGEHDRAFYKAMWDTITAGHIWTGRTRNRRSDGTLYWERKTISAVFDSRGQIMNYVSVGDDITIEMQTQQKLAEADKMSAIGMLAAGVAHEFKNYLGGIIGNASFALDELENEDGTILARETLTQIIEMGDRANDVAMSLLSYSKARPDDFTLEDLRSIITRSISLVEKEMKNLSIEVVTYFEEAPKVEVSASKIQQLLLNLLINAQHAIENDGVITVCLFHREDHLEIKVADSGVGIPEAHLGKIFDPFYSTKGVWGKDELVGTGMGLSICRNIAREHDGDLTVDSVVGIGTNFTLTIPLAQSDETAAPATSIAEHGNLRVLIFALQKSILTAYFPAACEIDVKLLWVDSVAHIGEEIDRIADLVVCDAKFTGKVELLRMVELCAAHNVPFVLVNCGVMEYQLAELYEMSRANFKELPDFARLLRFGLDPETHSAADIVDDAEELL